MSGERLARIIDQKYTDGKLILPKDDISLFDLLESGKVGQVGIILDLQTDWLINISTDLTHFFVR